MLASGLSSDHHWVTLSCEFVTDILPIFGHNSWNGSVQDVADLDLSSFVTRGKCVAWLASLVTLLCKAVSLPKSFACLYEFKLKTHIFVELERIIVQVIRVGIHCAVTHFSIVSHVT
eukprot:6320096-Amphidinium_carterae.3